MPQVSSVGSGSFFAQPALAAGYVEFPFVDQVTDGKPFVSFAIALSTDNTVTFSTDGVNDHGTILAADGLVIMENRRLRSLYLKGTGNARLMVW